MKSIKINRKVILMVFCTVALILVLENPSISQINVYYSYTSLSESQPSLNDGFFVQGSSIISQNTLTYINQTTNQPVGYKSELSIFNFGSFFVCFIPLITYLCLSNNNIKSQKIKRVNKK
jgi:hypothetical protein